MWRKTGLVGISAVLLLSGCLPGMSSDEEESPEEAQEEEETTVEVSPDIPGLDEYYRSILEDGQYVHGQSRGFSTEMTYNRLDLERLETGMQEFAVDEFNQDDYFFREGRYITREELNSWLSRQEDASDDEEGNPDGLNPALGEGDDFETRESDSPRTLSNLIEHNYMVEDDGDYEPGGVMIGLSMNSTYYFREELDDGSYGPWLEETIDQETSLEDAERIAQEITERLRSEERGDGVLEDVPIMFAVFREASRDASVPGEFIATGIAQPGNEVGSWNEVDENHYLFPSTTATDAQRSDAEAFDSFQTDINNFFENFTGVVGEGYYQNGEMRELSIEIPIRFYSKTEVIAFTQFVVDRMEARFPSEMEIEIEINSTQGQEALIVRESGEDPYTHIY